MMLLTCSRERQILILPGAPPPAAAIGEKPGSVYTAHNGGGYRNMERRGMCWHRTDGRQTPRAGRNAETRTKQKYVAQEKPAVPNILVHDPSQSRNYELVIVVERIILRTDLLSPSIRLTENTCIHRCIAFQHCKIANNISNTPKSRTHVRKSKAKQKQ